MGERRNSSRNAETREIYARVGRLRAQSETMSYVDVSRMIERELNDPIVKNDPELRSTIRTGNNRPACARDQSAYR